MIRTHVSKVRLFAKRVIALVLSVIMVVMMVPFGTLLSASAADDDAIFVFTNKKGAGIGGISVTIKETGLETGVTQLSNAAGEVDFADLIEDTIYNYSVVVGTGYVAIADGSFIYTAADGPILKTVYAKAPTITNQPGNQEISYGSIATFTVAATGLGTLSYQWLKGGTPITGKTAATLKIDPVTTGGDYSCVVTSDLAKSGSNTTTSSVANLTVKNGPPTITTQPQNQTKRYGEEATFTVAANGFGTLSYQWLKGGTPITGKTAATLTVNPVITGGVYSCTVTSTVDEDSKTTTSTGAALTVENGPPTITTQPQTKTIPYGSIADFTVEAIGFGTLSYQWKKDDTTLVGKTAATLTINPVITGGVYSCVVTSTDGEDLRTTTSDEATLTVERATPIISIETNRPSESTYDGGDTKITATITYPVGVGVAKPSGNVKFYVDNMDIPKDTIAIDAENNPTTYSLVLNSSVEHNIKVVYVGDANYNSADASISSYKVGKVSPDQGTYYTVNIPTGTGSWYRVPLTIKPILPTALPTAGLFDGISESNNPEEWSDSIVKNDDTAAGTVTFYLHNSTTGEVSNPKTINYKLDSTAPTATKAFKSFGKWLDGKFTYTIFCGDNVSGIAECKWRYRTEPDNWNTVELNGDGEAEVSLYWWQTGIVIQVTDNAGNTNTVNTSKSKIVSIPYPEAVLKVDKDNATVASDAVNADTRFIHRPKDEDGKVLKGTFSVSDDVDIFDVNNVSIAATLDGAPLTGTKNSRILTATKDGEITNTFTVGSWTETAEDSGVWTADYSVTGDGAYVFSISLNGYRYQSSEYDAKTGEGTAESGYVSNTHIIDTTPPTFSFIYAPETLPTGLTAFGSERVATISITDKNFRPDELSFTSFSAVNSNGIPLLNQNDLGASLLSALKGAEWGTNGDIHSAKITFSVDATYSFVLSYTDLAGNSGSSAQQSFTVDKTSPDELKIKYHTSVIPTIFSVLTFGFFNPSVTIELIADDATSGVKHFDWTYTQEKGSNDINKPSDGNTEPLDATGNGKTRTAEFTLTADKFAQYRGTITFTATDNAGNVSALYNGPMYYNADENENYTGFVIDTLAPTRVVTYSEPNQIRDKETLELYTEGDIAARVNIESENVNSILYYTTSVTATIQVTEANFYADEVIIKVNGEIYTNAAWVKTLDSLDSPDIPDSDVWTGTVILSAAGVYVITVDYKDRSGNQMAPYQSSTIYIDGTSPTIDRVNFAPAAADEIENTNSFIDVLEYGFYFKTDFIATVNVSDADPSSGLDEISYRMVPYVNGEAQTETIGTAEITQGVATISIPAGFKGQIFVEAFDNTRNTSGEKTTQAYVIDDTAPTITIVENDTTPYTDANGNKLYTTDMSVTVTITDIIPGNTDTVSGIKEFGYAQSSEKDTYARKNIQISNTGYKVGDSLGDGWSVVKMDANLVTTVAKTFAFNSDDNDIILTFDAKDRSGNQKQDVNSESLTVDKTNPIINITFRDDDDSDVYYNANRIADITVIERNFNASLIEAAISNEIGTTPKLTFTEKSNTEQTAVLDFDEGDYTFAMSGTDLGDQTATVNYAGGNEKLFFVDKTKPAVTEENFSTFSNAATRDSFNANKTATIKVNEHNFDSVLTNLKIFRKGAGAEHNNTGLIDVTRELLNGISWVDNGDLHTIEFTVSNDAVYQIEITPADLAGNTIDRQNTVVFEIDQKNPELKTPEDKTATVYVKPATEEPSAIIKFDDLNIKEIIYVITSYNFIDKENSAYELVSVTGVNNTVQDDKVVLPDDYFKQDGIYEIKATAYDYAGNNSGEKYYTYVVMRNTAVLAYIRDVDLKKFNDIGTQAINFKDIPIFVYTANDAEFTVKIGEITVSSGDYRIENDPINVPFLNQVKEYDLVIPQIFISKMFNEVDQVYDMPINILNAEGQILTLGRMVIDNVKPFGEFEAEMKNGKGYYNVDTKTVRIIKLSDDIDKDKTTVLVDNTVTEFTYEAEKKTISFVLEESSAYGHPWAGHDIKVTLVDRAGNDYPLDEISNVYVGNWFFRYWSFFTVGGVAVIVGGLLWWKPWRKKED